MCRRSCALLVVTALATSCAANETRPDEPAPEEEPTTFDGMLASLDAASDRQAAVDGFLAGRSLPLTGPVAPGAAVFIARLPAGKQTIQVAGDFDDWRGTPTQSIDGTDVRYLRVSLPDDARVDYKIVVDGEWLLDPLNARKIESGFGDNSELAMPAWRPGEDLAFDAAIAHGTLNGAAIAGDDVPAPLRFRSELLGNERDVWLYAPSAPPPPSGFPVVVVHDGGDYLRIAHMQHVLDANIARGAIAPVVAVFVSPVEREAEYVGAKSDAYVSMIHDELLPFVAERVGVELSGDDGAHATWGTSYSGFVAMKLAAAYPTLFGRVASQSGRVLIDGGASLNALRAARVWLDTGTIHDTDAENRDARDRLQSAAQTRGDDVALAYLEVHEGHSWGSWRARLAPWDPLESTCRHASLSIL